MANQRFATPYRLTETFWTARTYESALLASHPRRRIEQAAPVGKRRAVGDGTTFALPGDVLTAGTRDGGDDHVSWQQPVTASTALGRSIHPVCMGTADGVANISSHTHTLASLISVIQGGR